MRRGGLGLALAIVTLMPAASAQPADPHVTDPAGDAGMFGLDLRAAWIEWKGYGTLAVNIQVEGGFASAATCSDLPGTPANPTFRWAFLAFRPVDAAGNDTMTGDGRWVGGDMYATCTSGLAARWAYSVYVTDDTAGPRTFTRSFGRDPTPGTIRDGVAVIDVPLAAFGLNGTNRAGAILKEPYAKSFVGRGEPFPVPRGTTSNLDLAPAEGYGRAFQLGVKEDPTPGEAMSEDDGGARAPALGISVVAAMVAGVALAWRRRPPR